MGEEMFREEGSSNYLVVFLRLLTSKQLQLEGEFYQAFMEGGATVASFCSTEVEPMYKESDHIHIIGLTAAAGIGVRVVYLDRGEGDSPTQPPTPSRSRRWPWSLPATRSLSLDQNAKGRPTCHVVLRSQGQGH